jgi:hypothetical protein
MAQSITDWLQESRLTVVAVEKATNRLRVKGEADLCSDLTCRDGTLVVTDDETRADLDFLNPGDIIKVEPAGGPPERIVVVRRVWEELASPEL